MYYYAALEFIEKIEATVVALTGLDKFYNELKNEVEHAHLIEKWPKIHQRKLPEIISIHSVFLKEIGGQTYDTCTDVGEVKLVVDITQIPSIAKKHYFETNEFEKIYKRFRFPVKHTHVHVLVHSMMITGGSVGNQGQQLILENIFQKP